MTPRNPRKTKGPRPFEPHATVRSDDANAFIPDPENGPARTSDDLAESLAEDFLEAATTAQDPDEERLDSTFPEEIGGPFVETSADDEMALDTDANNPPDATREALPRAVAGIVVYPGVEDPAGDSSSVAADDDEDEERDTADPRISPREADPARDVDELNEERGGRTTS